MSLRYMFNLLRPRVTTSVCVRLKTTEPEKKVVIYDAFNSVAKKNKSSYIQMINMFIESDSRRRGHVEFIYAALGYLDEFGVNKDLDVYKALLEVLPKGRFIPTNIFQAEFMHFPKQQQCAVDLLEKMEDNGVMPDFEMQDILMTVFGERGIPLRKFWRMMYWMPKFRNLSPWYLPQTLPADAMELARLALARITSVDNNTAISLFHSELVPDSLDSTWILSAQSPTQIALLTEEAKRRVALKEKKAANDTEFANMEKKEAEKQGLSLKGSQYQINKDTRVKSPDELKLEKSIGELEPLTVHGPYKVHLRDQLVSYFVLSGPVINRPRDTKNNDDVSNLKIPPPYGSPSPPAILPNVHEQDDGTVLAICATGSSSRDSLLSWIRLLEKNGNPDLGHVGVVFTLVAPPSHLAINVTDVTAE